MSSGRTEPLKKIDEHKGKKGKKQNTDDKAKKKNI